MELPPADVEGVDVAGAAGEQHVGEAAGRGADVEGDPAGRVEAERVQGARRA